MWADQPTFYVATGPSGGGKSAFLRNHNIDTFNIDDHAAILNNGSYRSIPKEARDRAFEQFKTFASDHLRDKQSFATETTLRDAWILKNIEDANKADFKVVVSYIAAENAEFDAVGLNPNVPELSCVDPLQIIAVVQSVGVQRFNGLACTCRLVWRVG